jgi:hypothetical protein
MQHDECKKIYIRFLHSLSLSLFRAQQQSVVAVAQTKTRYYINYRREDCLFFLRKTTTTTNANILTNTQTKRERELHNNRRKQ